MSNKQAPAPVRRRNPREEEVDFEFDFPDGDDVDDGREEVVNISSQPAKFFIETRHYVLKPGQGVRIERAYTIPLEPAAEGGDQIAPVVMRLTGNRVVPITHKDARNIVAQREAAASSAATAAR